MTGRVRRPGRGARRGLGVAAVIATVALVASGCLPGLPAPTATSTPTGERVAPGLERYYHQELVWSACGAMQCATAIAPMDWADPEQGTDIELALVRQPATGGDPVGSLIVNPGGPGASGVDFVRDSIDYAVGDAIQRRFDVVGLDPRGVGASTAIDCGGAPVLDEYLYSVPDAEFGSDAWIAALRDGSRAFGAACAAHSGELLAHVDTASAARDLDMLRAALGDDRLDYLGYSYGTLLGAVYAELFPERTGRLVLDGAIDPAATDVDMSVAQAAGFERAFDAYAAWCGEQDDCPFDGDVAAIRASVGALLATIAASPLAAADGREVGAQTMFTAIILPLYSRSTWPALSELFATTLRGDPASALSLADAYNGRGADGTYASNLTEAFTSIFCLDARSDASLPAVREQEARVLAAAPLFGPFMAYGSTGCADWPVPAVRAREPIVAAGSADILVIGTTRDPATPYEWAATLAGTLEHGHLVSFDGDGHTAYNKGSACVDDAVESFLLDGVVPAADPHC